MTQLQINSPEMQDIFKRKFNSNQDKFMEFILSFLQDNKNIVDKYFEKNRESRIAYKKLNPMEHYYRLEDEESEGEMTNPFDEVEDSISFAKELREKSYR